MSKTDPTKDEMGATLVREHGAQFLVDNVFEAEAAIYWHAHLSHQGQWSNLYEVLSKSEYRPGPLETPDKLDEVAKMFLETLRREH